MGMELSRAVGNRPASGVGWRGRNGELHAVGKHTTETVAAANNQPRLAGS